MEFNACACRTNEHSDLGQYLSPVVGNLVAAQVACFWNWRYVFYIFGLSLFLVILYALVCVQMYIAEQICFLAGSMGALWFLVWLVYVPEWPSDDELIASRERSLFESCAIYAKQRAHEIRRERTESCRSETALAEATSGSTSTGDGRVRYSALRAEAKARLGVASARLRAVPALAMLLSAPLWAIFVAMFCRVWMWYFLVLYQSFYVRTSWFSFCSRG